MTNAIAPAATEAAAAAAPAASTSTPDYRVILCSTQAHLQEAHRIRVEVFHEEQGFPLDTEVDSYDAIAAHFLLVSSGQETQEALGTLRWVPYPPPAAAFTEEGTGALKPSHESTEWPLGGVRSQSDLTSAFVAAGNAKLGRLAVRKASRGKKLGAFFVRQSEDWIRGILQDNLELQAGKEVRIGMRLHSQMYVVKFYEGLGYQPDGEPFDEDGAPHLLCKKEIVVHG